MHTDPPRNRSISINQPKLINQNSVVEGDNVPSAHGPTPVINQLINKSIHIKNQDGIVGRNNVPHCTRKMGHLHFVDNFPPFPEIISKIQSDSSSQGYFFLIFPPDL